VSRTSISIYNLFAASIAEHERNVAVLPHIVPIATTSRSAQRDLRFKTTAPLGKGENGLILRFQHQHVTSSWISKQCRYKETESLITCQLNRAGGRSFAGVCCIFHIPGHGLAGIDLPHQIFPFDLDTSLESPKARYLFAS
jgi:hypothetical protein